VPADALAVHGLTAEFLADKPLFGAIADGFLAFGAARRAQRGLRQVPFSMPS
jgi:DNA polymerase III epsilon subunit-like protein